MTVNQDLNLSMVNRKVNTVVGLKQYQNVKKVMETFDMKMQQELNKVPNTVNQQIK